MFAPVYWMAIGMGASHSVFVVGDQYSYLCMAQLNWWIATYIILHIIDLISLGYDFGISSAIPVSVLTFVALVTAVIITVLVVLLTRVRSNNKKILEQLRQVQGNAVYEEIVCKTPPGSPTSSNIDENIAYDRVTKTTVITQVPSWKCVMMWLARMCMFTLNYMDWVNSISLLVFSWASEDLCNFHFMSSITCMHACINIIVYYTLFPHY